MCAAPEVLLDAVGDDKGVDLDLALLPAPRAARDGLPLEAVDARAVADEGVRKDDVARVGQVEAGDALLEAQHRAPALKLGERGRALRRVAVEGQRAQAEGAQALASRGSDVYIQESENVWIKGNVSVEELHEEIDERVSTSSIRAEMKLTMKNTWS